MKHTSLSTHTCGSQCDDCHDVDNCVVAVTRIGDLLLCAACAKVRRDRAAANYARVEAAANRVHPYADDDGVVRYPPGSGDAAIRFLSRYLP